ncbi:MAG: hypothetical protein ACYDBM_02770 [Candidatus Tyrphobacter sp.]
MLLSVLSTRERSSMTLASDVKYVAAFVAPDAWDSPTVAEE